MNAQQREAWRYYRAQYRGSYGRIAGVVAASAAVSFLTLPVIGLYCSLRCRSFITAFLAAFSLGLLTPLALAVFMRRIWWLLGMPGVYSGAGFGLFGGPGIHVDAGFGPSSQAAAVQMVAAVCCWFWLVRRLKQRAFPLERTEG